MKKVIVTLALTIAISVTSCRDKKEPVLPPEPVVETPAPENEEVVPPIPMPKTPEEADGTSVKVNSDGVSVDTKNGSNKTNVDVNNGGAAVEIKK